MVLRLMTRLERDLVGCLGLEVKHRRHAAPQRLGAAGRREICQSDTGRVGRNVNRHKQGKKIVGTVNWERIMTQACTRGEDRHTYHGCRLETADRF